MPATCQPRLTFACELPADRLSELVADTTVAALTTIGARVSLALVDLSEQRAAAVRRLNGAGVPVVAIPLAPLEDGYFFNLDNAPAATRAYDELRTWTRDHRLAWDAIAFDLEPSAADLRRLFEPGRRLELLRDVLPRALDEQRLRRGTAAFAELIGRVRADGFALESYQFPFVVDDRAAGTWLVRRLMSLPAVHAGRETLMLYTSFQGPAGPAVLSSYGPSAQAIAVGSTGGADEPEGGIELPTLSWDELARDLRLARRFTGEITIHSLEGCLRQGMLSRLEGFDWDAPVGRPGRSLTAVDGARKLLQATLTIASPLVSIAARRRRRSEASGS